MMETREIFTIDDWVRTTVRVVVTDYPAARLFRDVFHCFPWMYGSLEFRDHGLSVVIPAPELVD